MRNYTARVSWAQQLEKSKEYSSENNVAVDFGADWETGLQVLAGKIFALAAECGIDLAGLANQDKFYEMVVATALHQGHEYLTGIRNYRHHPARRVAQEQPVIWREGTTILRDYGALLEGDGSGGHKAAPPVLVVPSLINRFYILDLQPEHSFLRSLVRAGFRPLVIDWQAPGETERTFGVDDYLARLNRALNFVSKDLRDERLETPGVVHILGYCMGGLLALALASLRQEVTQSLSLLATPWNFPVASGHIADFEIFAARIEPLLQHLGEMPVFMIEALFAALQPGEELRKFRRFSRQNINSDEAGRFVLTEDWLNDGVPLSKNVALCCLRNWYGRNETGKMQWKALGKEIDPRRLEIPTSVIIPGKDKIVPPSMAAPLGRLIKGAHLSQPHLGHIGLLASKSAEKLVWDPLIHWLKGVGG